MKRLVRGLYGLVVAASAYVAADKPGMWVTVVCFLIALALLP